MAESSTLPEESQPPLPKSKNTKIIFVLIVIIIVLLLGFLGAGIWGGQQIRSMFQHFQSENQVQQRKIAEHFLAKQSDLQQQISLLQVKLQKQQQLLNSQQAQLIQLKSGPVQISSQQALTEVSYLIHWAHWDLLVTHQVSTAIRLLTLAQEREKLLNSNDPTIANLRQSISLDLQDLQVIAKRMDIEVLIYRLDQLRKTILALPWQPSVQKNPPKKEIVVKQPVITKKLPQNNTLHLKWYQKTATQIGNQLNALWQTVSNHLQEVIVIERTEQPQKIYNPQTLKLVRGEIDFALMQAEWAVLQQQTGLYRYSLSLASGWLVEYYPDPRVSNELLNKIQALAAIPLEEKNSALLLNRSLQAIDQAMAKELSSVPPINTQKKNEKKNTPGVEI